jgi:hypothetical protein
MSLLYAVGTLAATIIRAAMQGASAKRVRDVSIVHCRYRPHGIVTAMAAR